MITSDPAITVSVDLTRVGNSARIFVYHLSTQYWVDGPRIQLVPAKPHFEAFIAITSHDRNMNLCVQTYLSKEQAREMANEILKLLGACPSDPAAGDTTSRETAVGD